MPKISVKMDADLVTESTLNEILSSAQTESSAGEPPAAEVERDSNGKLVSVNVHLPDNVDAAGLQKATDAISNNSGVSRAKQALLTYLDDYNDVGSNSTFTSRTKGGVIVGYTGTPLQWKGTQAGGQGGSARAAEVRNTSYTNPAESGIRVIASANGFSKILAWEIEGDIFLEADPAGGGGESAFGHKFTPFFGFASIVQISKTADGGNYFVKAGSALSTPQDTGSTGDGDGYLHFKMTMDQARSISMEANSVKATGSFSASVNTDSIGMFAKMRDVAGGTARHLRLDNLSIKILDAVVL